jgi:hypothetical protein
MREGLIRTGNGFVGNNVVVSTNMCSIQDLGPGRWKIWGTCRHTLEDGCKLVVGAALIFTRIPQAPNQSAVFGPISVDVLNTTDDVFLQLAVATGASDTASGIIYAQQLNQ